MATLTNYNARNIRSVSMEKPYRCMIERWNKWYKNGGLLFIYFYFFILSWREHVDTLNRMLINQGVGLVVLTS